MGNAASEGWDTVGGIPNQVGNDKTSGKYEENQAIALTFKVISKNT